MTPTAVVIVGAGATGLRAADSLLQANISDFEIVEYREVISSVFDDRTDTWMLKVDGGKTCHGQVVIAAHTPMQVPWIPKLPGCNGFGGVSLHAAALDRDFDAAGKRVAVVGADASAGHTIPGLIESAASVTVFAHPPRRFVANLADSPTRAKRLLRRRTLGRQTRPTAQLVRSPIETVTESGIRTCDGVDHGVDAIIYGTGYSVPDNLRGDLLVGTRGVTIQQAWHDGVEPFAGVAVHGFPNYFLISGPDDEAQLRYVLECLLMMRRAESTRIEVRRSSQQVFNERVHLRGAPHYPVARAFDLSAYGNRDDEAYDGPATLNIGGTYRQVHVRLTGHVDPLDGKYHWQGTVFDLLPADVLKPAFPVTLTVGQRSTPARITEQTPQGTHSIAGVGEPPFAVDDVELATPQS